MPGSIIGGGRVPDHRTVVVDGGNLPQRAHVDDGVPARDASLLQRLQTRLSSRSSPSEPERHLPARRALVNVNRRARNDLDRVNIARSSWIRAGPNSVEGPPLRDDQAARVRTEVIADASTDKPAAAAMRTLTVVPAGSRTD